MVTSFRFSLDETDLPPKDNDSEDHYTQAKLHFPPEKDILVLSFEYLAKLPIQNQSGLKQDHRTDFEEIDMHLIGFSYFSWSKKITCAFIVMDQIKNMSGQTEDDEWIFDYSFLGEYFPKNRDRVTFLTFTRYDFDNTLEWYNIINWKNVDATYIHHQQHAVVLVDTKNDIILAHQIL